MQNIGSLAQGLTLVRLYYYSRSDTDLTCVSLQILFSLYGSGFSFSVAFTIVAIFNLVRQGFVGLPITVVLGEMYFSTFKRIQEFIINPDIIAVPTLKEASEPGIHINDATFKWGTSATPTLKNLTLKVCVNREKSV